MEDIKPEDFIETRSGVPAQLVELGHQAIQEGKVGVVTLWPPEWEVVGQKAREFAKHFIPSTVSQVATEVSLRSIWRKIAKQSNDCNGSIPHVFTTSYLTDDAIRKHLTSHQNHGLLKNQVYVSTGRSIGMRMIPMIRDLRFLWEETAQQILDEQQQKDERKRASSIDGLGQTDGRGN